MQPGPVDAESILARARAAHASRRFVEAAEAFRRAREHEDLGTSDVLAWSQAAWWLGDTEGALELAELGHRRLLAEDQPVRAGREALDIGFLLLLRGDVAAGSGWLQRGRSLLASAEDDHARAHVTQLEADEALAAGDLELATALARDARAVARDAGDPSLESLALMTLGTARLHAGDLPGAMRLIDEAMLPVRSGTIAPEQAGNLYCQVIQICWDLADVRRAREWTAATERWCEQFDSAVMFSGVCRMHRVQLRQLAGDWRGAEAEAEVVCGELTGMNVAVVAEGHYLRGELLRLRGAVDEAAAAYRRADELGRDPEPGRALLLAERGQPAAALAALRTALADLGALDLQRVPLLRAAVEVAIAAHDLEGAAAAADELTAMAARWGTDGLHAADAHARGAVGLATGDTGSAVRLLRDAARRWRELEAPHEAARSRLLLAEAYLAAGRREHSRREREAAVATFEELGALVDLRRARRAAVPEPPGRLTAREAEVLALVAEGLTNREVAARLVISERTVARHLANIYPKLGVSTRTAAAAWALHRGLGPPA